MFDSFDRKHLGSYSKIYEKISFFQYQVMVILLGNHYLSDFCKIIESCIVNLSLEGTFDITGLQKVPYKKLMKIIRNNIKNKPLFVYILLQFLYFT